ncbi:TPA: host cell division inhibitor Icd-like protein [Escherichia coli]|nr:host cell division inhibitor Icd-like protein [Escherichia coli]HAW3028297.1 host cell division inhibitor Icd-like protein [Escherichia coli]HAW4019589.1 host cell division inhibitor Icd-like protein [Escherichia coli]
MKTGYTPEQGRGFARPGETGKQQNCGFSGIKKAAPIRSRLSEQLTCCTKNKYEQWDYISQVTKRHNCRITGKTKATRYGGPSTLIARYPQRMSTDYYAVITSGWQCDQCAGLLVGYSCSLAFLRWRRLISPRMAVTINCAVLSPVSLTCSIASTTSCGARACNFCDLLLIWSLSISGFLCDYWNPVYTKKTKTKCLKWIPLDDYTGIQLSNYHSMQTRLKRIAVLSQPLTTNDNESIEVAMRNYTTHPQGRDSHNLNKYIWRFIALSTAQPRVITIEATSEQEARQQSPDGCVMVFAARIRQGEHHD